MQAAEPHRFLGADDAQSGWLNLLPLYVGLQAPCVSQSGLAKVSTNATSAATQGLAAADDAATQAANLGLSAGNPVWFDMEGYKLNDATCTKAVQTFVSAWDVELHARGYLAGVYGSAASTIRDIAQAATIPDLAWIANWNGVQSVFGDPNVSDSLWANHQRIHQYKGGHKETYGGVTINIDSSVVDSTVVGGSAPPPTPPPAPPTAPVGQVNSGDGPRPRLAGGCVRDSGRRDADAGRDAAVAERLRRAVDGNRGRQPGADRRVRRAGHRPPAEAVDRLVPAFSTDGTTWTPLPKLTSAGCRPRELTAYSVDLDGTIEIQTLVPGFFGLIADTTPPTAPGLTAKLLPTGLYLSWLPATDNGGVASYTLLRNGAAIETLAPTLLKATLRNFGFPMQTVYRLEATDLAGNVGPASRRGGRAAEGASGEVPRAVPQWAFALYAFQRHQGPRPAKAPKRRPRGTGCGPAGDAQP